MKLAISGKGGVGKTTLAAALALLMAGRGKKVLALDADPDANLAAALGIEAESQMQIIPISEQASLIEERTGAKVKQYGQMFKLNPEVSDIAGKFAFHHRGVDLLVLGGIKTGGSGCACPENTLIRALVADIILHKDDALVMDMEAGVEHLGRATARGVDRLIIVVEPARRSIESTQRILKLASDIGIPSIQMVINKAYGQRDEDYVRSTFPGHDLLGVIPYADSLRLSDRKNTSVLDGADTETRRCFEAILDNLYKENQT
jgi:CO dehydrogenase maturation factor